MSKTIEQIQSELDEAIPRSAVSLRDGGRGMQLSYLEGHYVIDRLNKVFGNLMWDSEVVELIEIKGTQRPTYRSKVRLTAMIQIGDGQYIKVVKEGIGYGSAKNDNNPHEMAIKEAETDGLKRAAMKFGMSTGLALYDKDQPNVAEDENEQKAGERNSNVSKTVETSKPESKKVSNSPRVSKPKEAAPSKEVLMKIISSASAVVLAQGKATIDGLVQHLDERYKAKKKEDLSEVQAKEFLGFLNSLSPGCAPGFDSKGTN